MAQITDTKAPTESVADQLTFWLHNLVDDLRAHTVRPLQLVVRGLIVAAFVSVIGTLIGIALVVGLFRLFDTTVFAGYVWATYLLFSFIFIVAGLIALKLARLGSTGHAGH